MDVMVLDLLLLMDYVKIEVYKVTNKSVREC